MTSPLSLSSIRTFFSYFFFFLSSFLLLTSPLSRLALIYNNIDIDNVYDYLFVCVCSHVTPESAAQLLAPPTDLCTLLPRGIDRFAEPTRDTQPSAADHLTRKTRAFCHRIVQGLQRRYGYAGAEGDGDIAGAGPTHVSAGEIRTPARVASFEHALMRVYRQGYLYNDYTPDLSRREKAALYGCQQLRCC
jgi:hypothetical protein